MACPSPQLFCEAPSHGPLLSSLFGTLKTLRQVPLGLIDEFCICIPFPFFICIRFTFWFNCLKISELIHGVVTRLTAMLNALLPPTLALLLCTLGLCIGRIAHQDPSGLPGKHVVQSNAHLPICFISHLHDVCIVLVFMRMISEPPHVPAFIYVAGKSLHVINLIHARNRGPGRHKRAK